ncbi:PIN domain-containing protein [Candidatus Micrarchaeota archaeon]|nr:PIN domain-containing protein [Candidatus Micrarchaeota archaeon]
MKIVADANVLFSGLLRDGVTRQLWFNPKLELYAPAFILVEFREYKDELLPKYGGTEEKFDRLSKLLLKVLNIVPDEELEPFLPAASSLSTDPKDLLYLACALKEDAAIWSQDKEFGKQKRVRVLTMQELARDSGSL